MRAPCYIEPVGPVTVIPQRLYGLRSWRLGHDAAGELRLVSNNGAQWRPGGKTTWARCATTDRWQSGLMTHPAPAPHGPCTCGLYAIHPWALERSWFVSSPPVGGEVIGLVEAWGRVHVYGHGFRSQYARPTALAVSGVRTKSEYAAIIHRYAEIYRAEVLEVGDDIELVRHCERNDWGMNEGTVGELLSGEGVPRDDAALMRRAYARGRDPSGRPLRCDDP